MPKKVTKKKGLGEAKIPYKSVVVCWLDSCEPSNNAEVEIHEIPKPQLIYQCGFLVKDEDEYVSVAGAFKPMESEGGTFDYVITIPKFAIKYIKTF